MLGLSLNLPKLNTGPFNFAPPPAKVEVAQEAHDEAKETIPFVEWLPVVTPTYSWQWAYILFICAALERVTAGSINRLMIFCPPRHGKSALVTIRYPIWRLERDPTVRVIVASYNQLLANRFSRQSRRIAQGRIDLDRERRAVEEWQTAQGGTYRAVGIGAGITGQGGDLIMIDDPIKSREEAESAAYRQMVWEWYTDDLWTRREPGASMVVIQTRWHEDDLAGRILASEDGPNWTVIDLPAEAIEPDPLGRQPGAALCPDRYDLPELREIRTVLGNYGYSALYQQRPAPPGGGMFRREWFDIVGAAPIDGTPGTLRLRYWDKAGTEGAGDWSCGVKLVRDAHGQFYIEDVVRGQWSALARERIMRQTAEIDGANVTIWIEQEPGSGGKESAQASVRNLAGFDVHTETVTGDKQTRAMPFAAQCEARNVKLVRGSWDMASFIEELCSFPYGAHDDQVDAADGAFAKLTAAKKQAGTW